MPCCVGCVLRGVGGVVIKDRYGTEVDLRDIAGMD